jgi:CDP-glucose 4,6-dehydratase
MGKQSSTLESMELSSLFCDIYRDKTVFITGHTGFKGSWLTLWLKSLGANVIGYSINTPTKPNHYELLDLNITSFCEDIVDKDTLNRAIALHQPDILFHLAAQPLVRESYSKPFETYNTNVMGTLNVLEACRQNSVKTVINITSDKVYENNLTKNSYIQNGFNEECSLGGDDIYSSSKSCSEILTNSYRNSFFDAKEYKKTHNTLLATVRAGNVIGGGDWAKDRIFTDIIKSATSNEKLLLRNPNYTRPWQHVLDSLSGYLLVGQKLLEEKVEYATSWNFGPDTNSSFSVEDVVKLAQKSWNNIRYETKQLDNLYESKHLKIDSTKAHKLLNWEPILNTQKAVKMSIGWYRAFYEQGSVNSLTDLSRYISYATNSNAIWSQ